MRYGKLIIQDHAWSSGYAAGLIEHSSNELFYYIGGSAGDKRRIANFDSDDPSSNAGFFFTVDGSGVLVSSGFDDSDFAAASHTHDASDIVSGVLGTARLGSGTANSTKYLRGDSSWQTLDAAAIAAGTFAGSFTFSSALNVGTPTASGHATTKSYVDSLITGLNWKDSVRVASTANVVIASALENGDSIDGITLVTGDRVLLKDQTDPTENGIYVAVASGAASRSTDTDSGSELLQTTVFVEEGLTNEDKAFVCTTDGPITLGSDNITFVQFGAGVTDHGALTGLSDDDHTQYLLLAGRSGGQIAYGGTGSGDDLTFRTTSDSSKGSYIFDELGSGIGHYSAGGVLTSSTIVNADVDAAAAIAWSKISKIGSSLADLATRAYSDLTGRPADDDFNTLGASGAADDTDYILIYDTSATAYKKQLRSVFLSGIGPSRYDTTFNLSTFGGSGTITHNLGQKYIQIFVYDENDVIVDPDAVTLINSNSLTLDVTSFGTANVTYNLVILA